MFRNMNIKNYIKGGAFAALTIFAVACSSDDSPAPVVPTSGSTGTAVDLGLSVKWADHNVGATTAEGYGNYYGWGDPTGTLQSKATGDYVVGLSPKLEDLFELQKGDMTAEAKRDTTIIATYEPKDFDKTTVQEGQIVFTKDGKVVVGEEVITYLYSGSNLNIFAYRIDGESKYDAATANWGSSWRMPTSEELSELVTMCEWTLGTQNGVKGYTVTGPNGNSIFLPLAGYRIGNEIVGAGQNGFYWSGVVDGVYNFPTGPEQFNGSIGSITANKNPTALVMNEKGGSLDNIFFYGVALGQTIRPVQE